MSSSRASRTSIVRSSPAHFASVLLQAIQPIRRPRDCLMQRGTPSGCSHLKKPHQTPQFRRLYSATLNQLRWNSLEGVRSEEHTSELQSQSNLVCRLLLEKK